MGALQENCQALAKLPPPNSRELPQWDSVLKYYGGGNKLRMKETPRWSFAKSPHNQMKRKMILVGEKDAFGHYLQRAKQKGGGFLWKRQSHKQATKKTLHRGGQNAFAAGFAASGREKIDTYNMPRDWQLQSLSRAPREIPHLCITYWKESCSSFPFLKNKHFLKIKSKLSKTFHSKNKQTKNAMRGFVFAMAF